MLTIGQNVKSLLIRTNVTCSKNIYKQSNNLAMTYRLFSSYPPNEIVAMPALSPTMTAGSIIKWNVQPGDSFAPGTSFCDIATDKATMTFEAQDDGFIAKLLVPAAAEVTVGNPVMITVADAKHVAAFANYQLGDASSSSNSVPAVKAAATTPAPAAAPTSTPTPAAPTPTSTTTTSSRVFASPLARKLLRDKGLGGETLQSIPGTGPHGRVIASDVLNYNPSAATATATSTSTTPVTAATTTTTVEDQAHTHISLAAAYSYSKQTIPHYTLNMEINLKNVLSLVNQLNNGVTEKEVTNGTAIRVSAFDIIIKASAAAMRTVPEVNSGWKESMGVTRSYKSVHVNITSGQESGGVLPVLYDVESASVRDISKQLAKYETDPASVKYDMGTFTITNVGMYGLKSISPIILPPQVAVLGVGKITDTVLPNSSNPHGIEVVPVVNLTLVCDHRVIDGAIGATYLQALKTLLENPLNML